MNNLGLSELNIDEIVKNAEQASIKHEYKPFDKAVEEYCSKNDLNKVERIKVCDDFYKLPRNKQDEIIVEAIKKNYPDTIDKHIFHFPFQWYYFITDKNYYFTLHSKPRPFSEREQARIDRMRDSIKSIEQSQIFQKAKANYKNAKSFYDDGMKELANMIYQADKYHEILTSYTEAKEELKIEIEKIEKACRKEKYFTLAPHELNRQVKIYLSGSQIGTFEKLGYKVIEHYRKETVKDWNNEFMNWNYEEIEQKHFYVQMSCTIFESACKSQQLLYCGRYIDEHGNEVELKKGRNKGCNNEHLNKPIILLNAETWEELKFETQNDLAKHFNIDKSNLSRKLKNREIGDCVKFNKVKYVIKGLTQTAHKTIAQ